MQAESRCLFVVSLVVALAALVTASVAIVMVSMPMRSVVFRDGNDEVSIDSTGIRFKREAAKGREETLTLGAFGFSLVTDSKPTGELFMAGFGATGMTWEFFGADGADLTLSVSPREIAVSDGSRVRLRLTLCQGERTVSAVLVDATGREIGKFEK